MADQSLRFRNSVRLVGVLSDYDLVEETRKNKNQDDYDVIRGNIVIDTGDGNTHNINVFYMAKFPNGNANGNYTVTKRILDGDINGNKNSIGMRIQLSASYEENSFVTNGELIKTYRVGGGFLETNPTRLGSDKAEFEVDGLITKDPIPEVRDDQETGRYLVDAELANYRGELYPVRFVIGTEGGEYLTGLDKPAVLRYWGNVVNTTVVNRVEEENAFGDPRIVEQTRTTRENFITGAQPEPREMTEILENYIKEGKQAYNVLIAQKEEAAKSAGGSAFNGSTTTATQNTPATPKTGEFNF